MWNPHAIGKTIFAIGAAAMFAACASMGRPEGGAKDELPPVFVRSNPAPGSLNFRNDKLAIYFDENIKVDDVMNKVVVSPVQKNPPAVSANGKRLSVEFRDTLLPDVTYTVDFSDAIRDLNEGNILDGFAIDFSTGAIRDSLVISGMVFEGRNLEPAQGMIVGVYSNLEDSAISTVPMERISKTNQYGQFVIRNLAPGEYRVFAINDQNRDYFWNRTEDVAFYDSIVVPSIEPIEVTDTLRSSTGLDSIVVRPGVRYLPNDILLTWFNENYKSQYLKNYSRIDSTRVTFEMGAPSDTFPVVTLLNTPAAGKNLLDISVLNHSGTRDSLTYWIKDKDVISSDTLLLETRYLRTDSLEQLTWTTDTLKLINKSTPKKADKKKKKSKKDEEQEDSVPKLTFLSFDPVSRNSQELHLPLKFNASQPIERFFNDGIHLEIAEDSLRIDLGPQEIVQDSVNRLLQFSLYHDWKPGEKYRFTADSAAVIGIYDQWNNKVQSEFTVKSTEEYSMLTFNLLGSNPDDPIVVELLDKSDKPVAVEKAVDGKAVFSFVAPATYYLRAFIDRNANGLWDTGSVKDKIQPEEVYYYPKRISIKKGWDISQDWNINELPIDAQKPNEIKKNKPKTKEPQQQTTDEEEEEDDDFYNPGFGGNRNQNQGNGLGNSRNSGRNPALRPNRF